MDERTVRRSSATAREWSQRSDDDIVAAYEAGAGLRSLAEWSGRNYETVRKFLIRRGVELRPPHVR